MSNKPPPGLPEEYHKQYFHRRNNRLRWQRKLRRQIPGSDSHREAAARVEQSQQRLNDFLSRTRSDN